MPLKKKHLIAVGALAFASCTFGATRTILDSSEVAWVTAVATNVDSDLMFVGRGNDGRMVQVDPAAGTVISTRATWAGAGSTPIAMTADGENNDRIWALHADGFVVNWADGLSIVDWFWPPPSVPNREYCDIDHASDGDFYVSTVDYGASVLWRRDGNSQVWSSATIPGGSGCVRIAHDLYTDVLRILHDDGYTLEERNADTLASVDSLVLDADGGTYADIDIFGNAAVGSGIAPYWPSITRRVLWSFDPDTGHQEDTITDSGATPSSVFITLNDAASRAEMLVSSTSGANTVVGVLLE